MNIVLGRRALNRATLARQLLLERATMPALDAVGHLVGMQAQVPLNPSNRRPRTGEHASSCEAPDFVLPSERPTEGIVKGTACQGLATRLARTWQGTLSMMDPVGRPDCRTSRKELMMRRTKLSKSLRTIAAVAALSVAPVVVAASSAGALAVGQTVCYTSDGTPVVNPPSEDGFEYCVTRRGGSGGGPRPVLCTITGSTVTCTPIQPLQG